MIGQQTLFNYLNDGQTRCVERISYDETKPFLLGIHYARRMPSISYAFGLFEGGELVGVVTYGVPASHSLCVGLAGAKNQYHVIELNRLCFLPDFNGDNRASYLVAHSLKMLPNRTFVVSYADTAWTHVGYVYQATNWLYTGATTARTDILSSSGHSRHYNKGERRRVTRSPKHRYIYLVGDKRTRREMRKELMYKVHDSYPKGNEVRYDTSNPKATHPTEIVGSCSIVEEMAFNGEIPFTLADAIMQMDTIQIKKEEENV